MEKYREKLARILSASGWTQEYLAVKLAVTFVTLNRWVKGKAEPRTDAKERIDILFAEILGADDITREDVLQTKKIALTKKYSVNKLLGRRAVLDRLTINLTYHSNGAEGSTMTEKDVAAVILDNKVLRNRTAIEQREAVNHLAALNFMLDELKLRGKNFRLTPDLVRAVHLRLMNGIISNAGEYRRHGARIRGAFVPLANYIKISELIKDWCAQSNAKTRDPLRLLAVTHAEFERIHPFSDGNGRAGRLLLFIKALQLGLVPPVINKERRIAYYKYLEICQTRGLSAPLERFIAGAIIDTSALIERQQ